MLLYAILRQVCCLATKDQLNKRTGGDCGAGGTPSVRDISVCCLEHNAGGQLSTGKLRLTLYMLFALCYMNKQVSNSSSWATFCFLNIHFVCVLFFMLNSTKLSTKFAMLINTKIPTNKEVSCLKSLRCCIYHANKC